MKTTKTQKYAAEVLGTFLLALLVRLSVAASLPLLTPVVAGLTLGLGVYMLGSVSGAHFNPAVTIALATLRKISTSDAIAYIIAQLLGGTLALFASNGITGLPAALTVMHTPAVALGEALGAAILVLGVSSVVLGKTPSEASGLTIGTALTLGALAASSVSNGIVNPAVALALGSLSFSYVLGPIVGGVIAAWGYRWIVRA